MGARTREREHTHNQNPEERLESCRILQRGLAMMLHLPTARTRMHGERIVSSIPRKTKEWIPGFHNCQQVQFLQPHYPSHCLMELVFCGSQSQCHEVNFTIKCLSAWKHTTHWVLLRISPLKSDFK